MEELLSRNPKNGIEVVGNILTSTQNYTCTRIMRKKEKNRSEKVSQKEQGSIGGI